MNTGRKMEEMTETVQTRLTPAQKQQVQSAAAGLGLTLAAFIRMAVLRTAKVEQ
jgi:uncharacterized protein (DUF1778 family)